MVRAKKSEQILLGVGITAANEALAYRVHFVLSDMQSQEFQQALDARTQPLPPLQKLVTKPGLLG